MGNGMQNIVTQSVESNSTNWKPTLFDWNPQIWKARVRNWIKPPNLIAQDILPPFSEISGDIA